MWKRLRIIGSTGLIVLLMLVFAAGCAQKDAGTDMGYEPGEPVPTVEKETDVPNPYHTFVPTEFVKPIVSDNLRSVDLVARYGGEEFVVVMPETRGDQAMEVAERLRRCVAEAAFHPSQLDQPLPVTISIGVAATTDPEEMAEDVLGRADEALYAAKENGRNQVRAADDTSDQPADTSAAT